MNNVKWLFAFKDINGKRYSLRIVDMNGYDGEPIALRGSSNPFETAEDDDEDFFLPVRTQSGYIRIVLDKTGDDIDVYDLIPLTNSDHRVELTSNVDGTEVVEWCGWMKADLYSHKIWEGVDEYEFPVICPLTALEYKSFETDGSDNRYIELHKLIYRIFLASGNYYRNVYFTHDVTDMAHLFTVVNMRTWIEGNSEYDPFSPNAHERFKVNKNYKEVLEDICSLFGWTLHIYGNDIYFLTHGSTQPLCRCTFAELNTLTPDLLVDVEVDVVSADTLTPADDSSEESVVMPATDITITSKTKKVSSLVGLPLEEVNIRHNDIVSMQPYNNYICWKSQLVFRLTGSANFFNANEDWNFQNIRWRNTRVGGNLFNDLIYYDTCSTSDYNNGDGTKGTLTFTNAFEFSTTDKGGTGLDIGSTVLMTSVDEYILNYGWIVLVADMKSCKDMAGAFYPNQPDTDKFVMSLSIGGQYWNGTSWQSTYATFSPKIKSGSFHHNYDPKDIFQTGYGLPSGYWIRVPQDTVLRGKMTIGFSTANANLVSQNIKKILMSRFEVLFDIFASQNAHNEDVEYNKIITPGLARSKEVTLDVSTQNKSYYGLNHIRNSEGVLLYSLHYSEGTKRPEERLLQRMYEQLRKPRIQRKITVRDVDSLRTFPIILQSEKRFATLSVSHLWRDAETILTMQNID